MPGAYGSVLASRGDDDETEERWREFEVATRAFTILENKRAKNLEVKTPKWKVKSCHGLWKVDSLTDLTDSITAVSDTAPTAFRQMDKTVMALMRRWNYRQEYIDQYLSVGGLPMMVRQTLNFYQGFLHAVHQQSLRRSSTSWHDSSARVMLLHHSKKLQEVRQHSGTFFEFLVATYVYLREASKKKFQDLALLQGVHDRLDTIHPTASQAGSDSGTTKTSNKSLPCSHCKSRELHNLWSLEHLNKVCPIKEISNKKVAACRKEILDRVKTFPNPTAAQLKSFLTTAIAAAKVTDGS
jgi:hypothetical protein